MPSLELHNRTINSKYNAFVMGIVNCNDTSFYSKSRGGAERALSLIEEGAEILDLGAESTRPGSSYISAEEEMERLIPVIREVRKVSSIPISIDTRKKKVMSACFEEGADILNDISALEDDPELAEYAALKKIPVILMHKRGIPGEMQKLTDYDDVFSEVSDYLEKRAEYAASCGIEPSKIIVDPGIGFAKNLEQNKILMAKCGLLCKKKYTVLMALSRKTCIGEITSRAIEDRLYGTLAADLLCVLCGAQIVRVHDVKPCVDTLAVLKSFKEVRDPLSGADARNNEVV